MAEIIWLLFGTKASPWTRNCTEQSRHSNKICKLWMTNKIISQGVCKNLQTRLGTYRYTQLRSTLLVAKKLTQAQCGRSSSAQKPNNSCNWSLSTSGNQPSAVPFRRRHKRLLTAERPKGHWRPAEGKSRWSLLFCLVTTPVKHTHPSNIIFH